jgi:hypothetical protein
LRVWEPTLCPKISRDFGLGKGSVPNDVRRAIPAVLKLQSGYARWPTPEERIDIAERIRKKFDIPNYVGINDGTLFPLETIPLINGEDYFTRKGCYGINGLITCDDFGRIMDIVIGWPGSVHENRVWVNSYICLNPEDCFTPREFLIGDSAFKASPNMIPCFKKPAHGEMPENKKFCNNKIAKPRVNRTLHQDS